MKVSTVQEVLEMEDDAIVYAFKATIKSAGPFFPAKDAESQSFQPLTLFSGGREIKAIVKNREEISKDWKGKAVYFVAHKGDKGWSGVKAKDNDYKGKVERVLWVTASAEVVLAHEYEAQGASEAKDSQPRQDRRPTGQPARRAATNSAPADSRTNPAYEVEEGVKEAKRMLWKSHNLMRHCLRLAEYDRECYREDYGREMTDEQFQAITSSHFIACRDTLLMLPREAMVFPPTKWAKQQALKANEDMGAAGPLHARNAAAEMPLTTARLEREVAYPKKVGERELADANNMPPEDAPPGAEPLRYQEQDDPDRIPF